MSKVNITFLETRVVQDQHAGTDLETRYEAGSTYGFEDARSAARWVRRGVAEFASKEDADIARETVGDIIDERAPRPGADELEDSLTEEVTVAQAIGIKMVAADMCLTTTEFAELTEAERLDALQKANVEIDETLAERVKRKTAPAGDGKQQEPPAGGDGDAKKPDFDALTDDELRAYIADRDGTTPHHNTGRAKLLETAKREQAAS